jgi:hypothetical protein
MNSDSNPEISALRNQVFIQLVALVVVTGTLAVYLYREASMAGKDLNATQQLMNNLKQSQPALMTFANELGAYGMTHTDIRPLLAKYQIVVAPTQPVPPAAKK